ncbi:hypothetical protein FZ983_27260 [Azospirillum sp. B21]|nr:hypothetical protein FZ983_27260 [Azospirillum sp. B21]
MIDMETLRRHWLKLPANWRRILTWGGAIGAVMFFIGVLSPPPEPEPVRRSGQQDRVRNVLSVGNARDVGVGALSAQLTELQKTIQNQAQEMQRLRADQARNDKVVSALSPSGVNTFERKLEEIDQRLKAAEELRMRMTSTPVDGIAAPTPADPAVDDRAPTSTNLPSQGGQSVGGAPASKAEPQQPKPGSSEDLRAIVRGGGSNRADTGRTPYVPPSPPSGQGNPPPNQQVAAAPPSNAATPAPLTIRTIAEEKPKAQAAAATGKPGFSYFLPAGALTKVTLLTGIDVPTGQQARKNPFPALARITAETRLPNRQQVDLQDCVVLISGYGDLSSSRAMLRGETISCMRSDGLVMEAKFPAYATGEDGRAGVRGRLVDKQGAVIARALISGFASGVSQAFNVRAVPIIQTAPTGGSQPYVNNYSENSLRSAAVSGAGSALDKIADHYLAMAADLYPVLEIAAGREIDVIMTEGVKLEFKPVATAADTTPARMIAASTGGSRPGNADTRRGGSEPGELPSIRPSARQERPEEPVQPFYNLPSMAPR